MSKGAKDESLFQNWVAIQTAVGLQLDPLTPNKIVYELNESPTHKFVATLGPYTEANGSLVYYHFFMTTIPMNWGDARQPVKREANVRWMTARPVPWFQSRGQEADMQEAIRYTDQLIREQKNKFEPAKKRGPMNEDRHY